MPSISAPGMFRADLAPCRPLFLEWVRSDYYNRLHLRNSPGRLRKDGFQSPQCNRGRLLLWIPQVNRCWLAIPLSSLPSGSLTYLNFSLIQICHDSSCSVLLAGRVHGARRPGTARRPATQITSCFASRIACTNTPELPSRSKRPVLPLFGANDSFKPRTISELHGAGQILLLHLQSLARYGIRHKYEIP